MIGAPALDQRDGARNDGALARADAARKIGKIGGGGSATRRHKFALEPRPPGARAALPRARSRSLFYMNLNEIAEGQSGLSATGWRLVTFARRRLRRRVIIAADGVGRDACVDTRARPLGPSLYSPPLPPAQVKPRIWSGKSRARSDSSSRRALSRCTRPRS